MSHPRLAPPLPPTVGEVLQEFRRTRSADAWVWRRAGGGWTLAEGTSAAAPERPPAAAARVDRAGDLLLHVEGGEPGDAPFLATVLARLLDHDAEARFFGNELAERYEEITLLYSISEILGSVISLERAAETILSEVVSVLRVQRAALWLFDAEHERLELVAAVGGEGQQDPISIHSPDSVTAAVFRDRQPTILDAQDEFPRNTAYTGARASFLSVPVSYTPPEGDTRTIGVINLIGRRSDDAFSAGDQKLMGAIASQIGSAIENSRLVAASLRQERLDREMELAHDLQLKLLPPLQQFDGFAEVAARCSPAESVGGDFYHLFRLPGRRIGVVIGDVSSHGFGAALIMALTMSAISIHASEGDSPAEVLRRTHRALIDELESTEMYLTLFYGVIDPERREIVYVNAGHSHAFRVTAAGAAERLDATSPPFGITDLEHYAEARGAWAPGDDFLLLFTDGLADALGAGEIEGERLLVQEAAGHRGAPLDELLGRLFALHGDGSDVPPDDRTAVLVRI